MADPIRVLVRRCLAPLAFGLPLFTVAFAVVMAGTFLTDGLGDSWTSRVLRTTGAGLLMLLVADALLLLSLLGLRALADSDDEPRAPVGPSQSESSDETLARRPPGDPPSNDV